MTIMIWPDLVAYAILIIAAFYTVMFFAMGLMFTEWGERLLGVLLIVIPLSAVGWAFWVVLR